MEDAKDDWIIGHGIDGERCFITRIVYPRFIAQIFDPDDEEVFRYPFGFAVPNGQVIANIHFYDEVSDDKYIDLLMKRAVAAVHEYYLLLWSHSVGRPNYTPSE